MSENSSDSESSCGWTVINHEGSDVEAVGPEYEGAGGHTGAALEEPPTLLRDQDQQEPSVGLQAEFDQGDVLSVEGESHSTLEIAEPIPEDEKAKPPDEGPCVGAISDDSDIVTLETPKAEETGSQEDAVPVDAETNDPEDYNLGSSTSSQYAFCQPETVFAAQAGTEESSSDEASSCGSPALRRRRAKKRLLSSSELEDASPPEQESESVRDGPCKHPFSSGLNRCVVLALVIAVSMGFGHFYGTIQIQKRQQLVEKTHVDELKDMKDTLVQCQQEQGTKAECKPLKEGLATCLLATEMEKKSFESQKFHLASENQRLRESLEREERALASLQEELRKLREQLRHLENKGPTPESVLTENQKLKAHLEEEKHQTQNFVKQKETLLAEAQMLRRELDKERQLTMALREELEKISSEDVSVAAGARGATPESQEIDALRGRLTELEEKLSFEQQRSDLWEKLYVEVKDHAEKQKTAGKGGKKSKKQPKATFFGSVKETFDAMKNSTKEFVRHHKEKIKQAKEAVKENLRKFSDSVKSTFRHFKDTTKNIFDEKEKKKFTDQGQEPDKKKRAAYQADGFREATHRQARHRAPGGRKEFRDSRRPREGRPPLHFPGEAASQECPKGPPQCHRRERRTLTGCTGIFDCAHQEFGSLFNKALDPIRADEFNQLMHRYLQQEVGDFHHWHELDVFVNRFFHNGVFIHDQMLFTDFVNDVKDYLEDMQEYQRDRDGVFEDLDKYIYRYYFHYDSRSPQDRGRHAARSGPFTHAQGPQQGRHTPKPQQRSTREGRWQKQGRATGRHMASLEIELGQLPFDPKY